MHKFHLKKEISKFIFLKKSWRPKSVCYRILNLKQTYRGSGQCSHPVGMGHLNSKRARNAELVKILLKPNARLLRQYPLKLQTRQGLESLIETFIEHKLLVECQSHFNTPILSVKKLHSNEHWLVQDLRAIHQIVQDVHLVVANPYTLLTTLKNSDQ